MAYYNTCPNCGANLDPGEPCDCDTERKHREEFYKSVTRKKSRNGQLLFSFSKEVTGYEKTAY